MIIRKIFISGLLLLPICLLIFLNTHAVAQSSTNYTMAADIMDVEGGEKTSTNYTLIDSTGQGIEGGGTASTNYILYAGFNGFAGEGLPKEYFVDCANGNNNNDGLSWAIAKATITNAITELDERPGTIYVAQGNYQENITLTPGLTLKGGYDSDSEERNINEYPTIIDGGANQGFSVVTGADDATIDGFTITKGLATVGGGIKCMNITNFTIRNNIIENNYAIQKGGGIFIYDNSDVLIENNSLIDNHAVPYTGDSGFLTDNNYLGGGIYVGNSSHPTINSNKIRENTSDDLGGGIYVEENSNPIIKRNYIEKNEALGDGNGGGIYITTNCAPSLTNNMITNNVANNGGGICIADQSQVSVVNNTIADNFATCVGGGIYIYSSPYTTIKNCIVWGNGDDLFGINCDMISFSIVEDGDCSIPRNDPGFVGGGDYHLTGTSPCIDAGTSDGAPEADMDGSQRYDVPDVPNTGGGDYPYYDMGAYEYIIPTYITVTSPQAGQDWEIGSTRTIEWTSSGAGDMVKIELGQPAGCWGYNWSTIISSTSNDESYNWTVQGAVQSNCKIRICSLDHPDCCGESALFDIVGNRPPSEPTITFSKNPIEPGELLQFCTYSIDPDGDAITYHWKIIDPNDGVNEFDTDDECSSTPLYTPGSYTFYCTAEDEYGAKSGTAVAKLIVGIIAITSPSSGEDWTIGSTYTIEWTSSGVDGDVKIEVSRPSACGRLWSHIAAVPVSDGSYPWPVEEPMKNNCIVRITSIDNPDIYGESGPFDIVEPPLSP